MTRKKDKSGIEKKRKNRRRKRRREAGLVMVRYCFCGTKRNRRSIRKR